ncbi:M24 family metallopeptidase [Halogeometricum limi]|uniref:Xaa-Pro aminopeptidase n=1 Tax=Halogeometricum limi TaxID=555875 RepID=A0A1I6IC24_9EURY|nr:Xaa-Pro peptidase family protein [Halogeometricum limi]SFR64243.1 Xaa-Pro aminopeptidase [Halogeometricum limi]
MTERDEQTPLRNHEFISEPHEYNPRRLFSKSGTDYWGQVNYDRLRGDRLAKARKHMEEAGLGSMLLFAGENIRYVTGAYQGNWKYNIFIRYAVLPKGGDPVLFETVGSDLIRSEMDLPWIDDVRPAMTWRWAEGAEGMMAEKMAKSVKEVLDENGVADEPVGVDAYDQTAFDALSAAGLTLENAWPAMSSARVRKTPDELELLKMSAAYGDGAMWRAMNEWTKPGIPEKEITAKVNEYLYRNGFDSVYDIIVASGGRTNPYGRWATDKILRQGDLVICDINAVGPGGYFIDYVRTWKVDADPTEKEIELYEQCYDQLYRAIDKLRPGNTTKDVAEEFREYDDDEYGSVSIQQAAHSIGISLYEGMWMSRAYSLDYPAEIEEGMYFAIETFAGHEGLDQTVRLEENVMVTDEGPVITTLCEHPDYFTDHFDHRDYPFLEDAPGHGPA